MIEGSSLWPLASCLLLPAAKQQNLYFESIALDATSYSLFLMLTDSELGLPTVKDNWTREALFIFYDPS